MTSINTDNLNHLWASLIVEELARNGVTYFCIAPGSRSSPLTMQAALNKKVKTFVHFDERGLAFHALGYASATGKPCAIITTSGTAAANIFPAIIEASKKKVPLIVLTADRPPELRFTGANQTIDQVKIFGDYARWFVDMPTPTKDIQASYILTTIDQAIARTQGELKGPVHINCMYREPLAPVKSNDDLTAYLSDIKKWLKQDRPFTQYERAQSELTKEQLKDVAQTLNAAQTGLIVIGKINGEKDKQSVLSLNQRLNWPIFADVTSGLRLGAKEKNVITYFDQALLSEKLMAGLKADCILHLGGRITSKRYYDLIERMKPQHTITVLNHPLRNDPLHNVSARIQAPVNVFCDRVKLLVSTREPAPILTKLLEANRAVENVLIKFFKKQPQISEFAATQAVTENIPAHHALFVASSLPIREVDMFGASGFNNIPVNSNRGASGIDGTIASACGYSEGAQRPVTLLIGDLAFLYDLNSLAMLKSLKHPMTVVILNNNGGGIFSFLPIAKNPSLFEKYFGTPHDLSFEQAAKMFGLGYHQPKTAVECAHVYQESAQAKNSVIIEVRSDRNQNTILFEKLSKEINSFVRWRSEQHDKDTARTKKTIRRGSLEGLRPIRRHQVS